MSSLWRRWLLALLKVPPPPSPPDDGGQAGLVSFRAAKPFLYLQLIKMAFGQAGALLGLILVFSGGVFGFRIPDGSDFAPANPGPGAIVAQVLFDWIETLGLIGFFLQLPVSFLLVILDYEQRCYYLSARSIRIREGVRRIREMTFTYDNIQEMSVQQGPLQRLLGIADLRVRTAGGGVGGEEKSSRAGDASASFHIGYFRGVADPSQIRETIRERLRRRQQRRDEEPDSPAAASTATGAPADATEAARSLAREARQLRRQLESTAAGP